MLTVVTAATVEPVTLVEAKAHLRVIHTSDDGMIAALLTAARETVELNTGRALAVASYLWAPEGCDTETLPLQPGTVTATNLDDEGEVESVEFDAAPGIVAAALKAGILLALSDLYESPDEPQNEKAIDRLITPHRVNFGV